MKPLNTVAIVMERATTHNATRFHFFGDVHKI
jgi:hypothetical protein